MAPIKVTYAEFAAPLAVILTFATGYLDNSLGFGFNLFPLYLIPLALVAWRGSLKATVSTALLASAIIILKLFLNKELYAHSFYWYWDAAVKGTLLLMFGYGLWRIRELVRLQQQQSAAKISELNISLQKQVEQLTAANRELEEMSYTISHDLRAPLRHVVGFVELLMARLETLDDKSRHYLEVIAESAQKMGDEVDALLAFIKLGRTEVRRTSVDLDQVVQEILRGLAREVEGRQIKWRLHPLPRVTGDQGMLHAAMLDLISNALKFTKPRAAAAIEIGSRETSEETQIYVRDNGVGFDMRYVNKLFGMFQRLHVAEEFEGIGAGLAKVRRIAQRHGGKVWAEGTVDGGAVFWLSLPKGDD